MCVVCYIFDMCDVCCMWHHVCNVSYPRPQAQEISHLIACQPVALKAVRLQALVPPYSEMKDKGDKLDKFEVGLVKLS